MYDPVYVPVGDADIEACQPYLAADKLSSSWKDVGLVLLVLVYSGNPAPVGIFPIEPQLVCLALFFGILLLRRSHAFICKDFAAVALIFAIILLFQCIDFGYYPWITIAGFFVRLFIGYTVFTVVKDFPRVYVRVMVGLAVVSFAFYIPYVMLSTAGINIETLITQLSTLLHTTNPSRRPLVFHTFNASFSYRNFGMFWEPGAFQGYLILAMIFLALIKHRLPKEQYRLYILILCVAVLTTMSTTGYLVLALVPFLHLEWHVEDRRRMVTRVLIGGYVVLPLLIGGSLFAYNKLPFLGQKIQSQLSILEFRQGRWHRERIGSLVFDWEYIKQRPLTGWGLHAQTRYALHPWMENSEGMGNGFSDFTAKLGVLGFLTWFTPAILGFWQLGGGNTLLAVFIGIILVLELQGECFLNYPFFLGLAFLPGSIGVLESIEQTTWSNTPRSDSAQREVWLRGQLDDYEV